MFMINLYEYKYHEFLDIDQFEVQLVYTNNLKDTLVKQQERSKNTEKKIFFVNENIE